MSNDASSINLLTGTHLTVNDNINKLESKTTSEFDEIIVKEEIHIDNFDGNHIMIECLEKPYECNLCGEVFESVENIGEHAKHHLNDRKCNEKALKLKRKSERNRHSITLTDSDKRSLQCNICKKMFKYKNLLHNHSIAHSDRRPFQCDICKKQFKTEYALKSHLITHSNLRPFKCDTCKATFKRERYLSRHKEVHILEYGI